MAISIDCLLPPCGLYTTDAGRGGHEFGNSGAGGNEQPRDQRPFDECADGADVGSRSAAGSYSRGRSHDERRDSNPTSPRGADCGSVGDDGRWKFG